MKKKMLCISLCCVLVSMFCACGSDSGSSEEISKTNENVVDAQDTQDEMPVIEEQVILDQDGLKITVTGLEYMEYNEYSVSTLSVLYENSSEEDMYIQTKGIVVNGYMVASHEDASVLAGKKAKAEYRINSDDLELMGLQADAIGEIELKVSIMDAEGNTKWSSDLLSVKTSEYDEMEVKTVTGGTEIYNVNGIKIYYLEMSDLSIEMPYAKLLIENTSDKDVTLFISGVTINGSKDVNSYNTPCAYAGKMAIGKIEFFKSNLEENEIESIEEISDVLISINDMHTGEEICDHEKISFSVK